MIQDIRYSLRSLAKHPAFTAVAALVLALGLGIAHRPWPGAPGRVAAATMTPPYALFADAVLVAHFAFVLFVALGGLLVLKWPRAAWAHIPAAVWGAVIEFAGWICPLTPLENRLRELAGESPYRGDFIARYLMPVIYPEGLTREAQVTLGAAALAFNLAIYFVVWRRGRTPPLR